MNQPLVSVIIPTFKRNDYICRAIDSVLEQTYENFEIIVVDDNLPKSEERIKTKLILEKYNSLDNFIYLELDDNYGGAIARNKGLEYASGKYVCFLDDDDEYLKDKLRNQVDIFEKSSIELAVVGGFANILDEKGNVINREVTKVKGDVYFRQLMKNTCTTSIAMIRKSVVIEAGGFEKIPSSQEHLFFIKVFSKNPYYDYVSKTVVNIYHHSGMRISTNSNKAKGAMELYEKVLIISENMSNNEKKSINHYHLLNITLAYSSINDSENSRKYLIKVFKNDKKIHFDSLKMALVVILGLENIKRLQIFYNKIVRK